jgi:hypothetical protein
MRYHTGFMGRVFLLADGGEVARRRTRLPRGHIVEAWPDLYAPGLVWIGETSKAVLDGASPLEPLLSVDAADVSIYYGPRLTDLGSLPTEESLHARILSAHGMAAAWITLDQFGERAIHKAESPLDAVFFLRRPGSAPVHQWRLFRTRAEATLYMREYYGNDPEAQEWAAGLPVADYEELIARGSREDTE